MEENKELNLVEILKDCPKGMRLYSIIYGEVIFEKIDHCNGTIYPICFYEGGNLQCVSKNGLHLVEHDGDCTLFPSKENRDWSTFRRPFKEGDVIITGKGRENECVAIFKSDRVYEGNNGFNYHSLIYLNTTKKVFKKDDWAAYINVRFATEEEKQKLFQAIKDNGYKWNPETKNVEKLEEEKPKWNPDTLQPFDKVLVRDGCKEPWKGDFFVSMNWPNGENYPYMAVSGYFKMIVPYNEDTKHLIATRDEAPEYYRQ